MFEAFRRKLWLRFRDWSLWRIARLRVAVERRCDLCGRSTPSCASCSSFVAAVVERRHPVEDGFYIDQTGLVCRNPGARRVLPQEIPADAVVWDLREQRYFPWGDRTRAPVKPDLDNVIWADCRPRSADELPRLKVSVG